MNNLQEIINDMVKIHDKITNYREHEELTKYDKACYETILYDLKCMKSFFLAKEFKNKNKNLFK